MRAEPGRLHARCGSCRPRGTCVTLKKSRLDRRMVLTAPLTQLTPEDFTFVNEGGVDGSSPNEQFDPEQSSATRTFHIAGDDKLLFPRYALGEVGVWDDSGTLRLT